MSKPIAGTLAASYLMARGIVPSRDIPVLRFIRIAGAGARSKTRTTRGMPSPR
jgi:hypothetical protein